jgi:hypothetical protein
MATGDGLRTARAVAGRRGIDEVHGEVKPGPVAAGVLYPFTGCSFLFKVALPACSTGGASSGSTRHVRKRSMTLGVRVPKQPADRPRAHPAREVHELLPW